MKVILIRHGQTDENVAHRHQPTGTPLSVTGRRQAAQVGEYLAQFHPSHIVASPIIRALQTASLIAKQANLIPSIDHNLQELQRPGNMTGYGHFSLRSLLFYKFWFLGFGHSGESYRTLRQRIVAARTHIEQLPDDSVVLVVSHTVFLNLFLAHLHRERALWPWQAVWVFWQIVRMKNTATVELSYTDGQWSRTNDLNLK